MKNEYKLGNYPSLDEQESIFALEPTRMARQNIRYISKLTQV